MKRTKFLASIVYILSALSTVGNAQTLSQSEIAPKDPPRTLRGAISAAITLNPKTISTDEFMESLHYVTQASKANMYPSSGFSCTRFADNSTMSTNHLRLPYKISFLNCGVSVSATVFDGGAKYYAYKSAQAHEAATRASFNTADSRIPNTRGGLANSTMSSYSELAQMKVMVAYLKKVQNTYLQFQKFQTSDNLNSAISQIEQAVQQGSDELDAAIEQFNYVVTLPAADDLEDMDSAIASLKIPASAEDAVKIALSSGPEVLRRNLNVQMAEYSLKSQRASLGPSVSVDASWDKNNSNNQVNGAIDRYNISGHSIGVTLRIPIDVSGIYYLKSAKKELASKISERSAAIADAQNTILNTYKRLESERKTYLAMNKMFEDQSRVIQTILDKINSGDTSTLVLSDMLDSVGLWESSFFKLQSVQSKILNDLFGIKQVTGLLFSDYSLKVY